MHPEEQNSPNTELSSEINLTEKTDRDSVQKNQNIDLGTLSPSLDIPRFDKIPFNIQERQENTRAELATRLISILSRTIVASFGILIGLLIMSIFVDEKKSSSFDKTSALVKDLATVIFTAQIGLVGTALGFYFGSKSSAD